LRFGVEKRMLRYIQNLSFKYLPDHLHAIHDDLQAIPESEYKISTYKAGWVLRAVFFALAFTGIGAAAAQEASSIMAGEAGHGTSGDSSVQVRPADN